VFATEDELEESSVLSIAAVPFTFESQIPIAPAVIAGA
jgi:hypothetical protein